MRAHFDIYGLPLTLTADEPRLLALLSEELALFRSRDGHRDARALRLTLRTLPSPSSGTLVPPPFAPYREVAHQHAIGRRIVTRYGRSEIAVILDRRRRRIEAALSPDPSLLPDPAYHYVFTQPVSPWLKERGFFFLHAGCVAEDGRGILLVGPPRSGKTTLTLAAVRGGLRFLGDEQPILSERSGDLRIYAFPRRIRIDRACARLYPELKPLLRRPGERIVFRADAVWPGCGIGACRPAVLLFPRFSPAGGLRLRRLGPTDALGRLLQDDHFVWYRAGPWNSLSENHLRLLRRLALGVAAYTLSYADRDLGRVPALFRRLLKRTA